MDVFVYYLRVKLLKTDERVAMISRNYPTVGSTAISVVGAIETLHSIVLKPSGKDLWLDEPTGSFVCISSMYEDKYYPEGS